MKHGAMPEEAQYVVENAKSPFPQEIGEGKRPVWGGSIDGRMLQVIYVLKRQRDVAFESVDPVNWTILQSQPDAKIARVIHAMDLTPDMKRQLRRRRR
jgi:hypothetical protein